jgi:sarcosine oxidase
MKTYDVIVLGIGGVGSAALFHAAQRGAKVLGLDRFPPGHDRGSSHGETRIIRQAYFEHANYVPLLLRAYELWHDLEQRTKQQLFFPVGLLQVGPAGGQVISGVLASARQHGLKVESLTAEEVQSRFPGFHTSDDLVGVFEPTAGYLRVEACVQAHAHAAEQLGAELQTDAAILNWRRRGSHFEVTTENNTYLAERLIVSPGAWAARLLADLRLPFEVRRKHLYWLDCPSPAYNAEAGCPTFLYELPHGVFYGFPVIDAQGLKCAEHTGGQVVEDPLADPREFDPRDHARVLQFLQSYLPGVSSRMVRHGVCFYTMTPDEHFVVDHHPADTQLAFAAGLSGHGFKFTSVLGEILADLVLQGSTSHPIDFLSARRLG